MRCVPVDQLNQKVTQSGPLDRFGGVLCEAGGGGVPLTFSHNVCGQRNHRDMGMTVLLLPGANLSAGFISIFVGHLNIALKKQLEPKNGEAYEGGTHNDYRVVERFVSKDQSRTFLPIPGFYNFQTAHLVKEMGEHLHEVSKWSLSSTICFDVPSY